MDDLSPPTIGPKENLRRARTLLRADRVRELLVVDDGKLVGMLNDQDIWAHCPTGVLVLEEQQANDLLEQIRVGGVMTLHPPVVTPETPLRGPLSSSPNLGDRGCRSWKTGWWSGYSPKHAPCKPRRRR